MLQYATVGKQVRMQPEVAPALKPPIFYKPDTAGITKPRNV